MRAAQRVREDRDVHGMRERGVMEPGTGIRTRRRAGRPGPGGTRRSQEGRATPALARLAGLPDWPGFDLLATHPEAEVRHIEVKGRAGRGGIRMEANEWKQACHLGGRYWLYVVFDCATPAPRLLRVQDPFGKLLARSRGSSEHTISARSLIEAAEQA